MTDLSQFDLVRDPVTGRLRFEEPPLSEPAAELPTTPDPDWHRWFWAQRLRGDAVGRLARDAEARRMTPLDVAREFLISEPLPDPLPDLFHGGLPGLEVGMTLTAAGEDETLKARPAGSAWFHEIRDRIDPQHRDFAYATTDVLTARAFALDYARHNRLVCSTAGGFGLYRVELSADVHVDPWRVDRHNFRQVGLFGVSVRASSATIVEVYAWPISP